ncbi:MAG: SCO1664 family protein [Actinobacteria bacterium]|nr:SCO1664 family protein [Actinomycetota bacterium]
MCVHGPTGITVLNDADLRTTFETAPVSVQGQFVDASNNTLLVLLDGSDGVQAVYKPVRGARPLHDFDATTLSWREVMAYGISRSLGLDCVPLTVWRDDLPFGPGSLQLFIDHDGSAVADVIAWEGDAAADEPGIDDADVVPDGFLVAFEGQDETGQPVALIHRDDAQLRSIALFDAVINNADRKAGHVLRQHGRWFAIDNGLSLHCEPKMRTVLWGWAGEPLVDEERDLLRRLVESGDIHADVRRAMADNSDEWDALLDRAAGILQSGCLPLPDPRRRSIPWPVF